MALKRYHLRVYGLVQGVGFRYYAMRLARSMNISGWVRNLHDGSVEIEAEGIEEDLEGFVLKISEGPPAAVIEKVVKQEIPPQGAKGFEVRF